MVTPSLVRPSSVAIILAAAGVLAGCSSPESARGGDSGTTESQAPHAQATALPPIVGTTWRCVELVDARGDAVNLADEPPTLMIGADGRASGFAGVNRYFGEATLGNARSGAPTPLRIAGVGATRMAGPPERMTLERAYLGMLESIDRARLERDASGRSVLVLDAAGKALARFNVEEGGEG